MEKETKGKTDKIATMGISIILVVIKVLTLPPKRGQI